MPSVHQIDPYKVGEIQTLKKPNEAQARELLEKISLQVQPILRKRRFVVPLLKEFYPRSANLMGINVGGGGGRTNEIALRLRRAGSESSFLPYDSILRTMLHEITHNVHSPHNKDFYKLMDELVAECEDLIARGISGTGAGFDANPSGKAGGRRLNEGATTFDRRTAALKAAEERARKQAIMPVGPQKLGGDRTLQSLMNAREAAAYAAERRLQDNKWCPAEQLVEEEASGHDINDALKAILGGSNDNRNNNQANDADGLLGISEKPEQKQAAANRNEVDVKRRRVEGVRKQVEEEIIDLTDINDASPAAVKVAGTKINDKDDWTCSVCTLVNKPLALQCEACLTVRPP